MVVITHPKLSDVKHRQDSEETPACLRQSSSCGLSTEVVPVELQRVPVSHLHLLENI